MPFPQRPLTKFRFKIWLIRLLFLRRPITRLSHKTRDNPVKRERHHKIWRRQKFFGAAAHATGATSAAKVNDNGAVLGRQNQLVGLIAAKPTPRRSRQKRRNYVGQGRNLIIVLPFFLSFYPEHPGTAWWLLRLIRRNQNREILCHRTDSFTVSMQQLSRVPALCTSVSRQTYPDTIGLLVQVKIDAMGLVEVCLPFDVPIMPCHVPWA